MCLHKCEHLYKNLNAYIKIGQIFFKREKEAKQETEFSQSLVHCPNDCNALGQGEALTQHSVCVSCVGWLILQVRKLHQE